MVGTLPWEDTVNLGGIDLNLLVALDALLTEHNVTRAGERVGLSQPAMSAALARLRRLFDDELLVRVGRGLEPTRQAVELAGPVKTILAMIEDTLERRSTFDPGNARHTFRIVASDYAVLVLIQPLISRLAIEAPGVSVCTTSITTDLFECLDTDDADLVILPEELADEKYPSQPLFSERWVCAVDVDNPVVGRRLTATRYVQLPHLAFSVGDTGLGLPERYIERAGVHRRIEMTCHSFVAMPFLLRGTQLVCLIQERLARRVADAANIRVLEPPFPVPDGREAMYWSPRNTADPAHTWLRGVIAELSDELDEPRRS